MPTSIDETELARLEKLAKDHAKYGFLEDYVYAACNDVPALVAEVRRLRRNYECSEKSLQRHEHMVAELMEKVEAWEWWEEVDYLYDNVAWLFDLRQCAIDELDATFIAAREAVHADRE